MLFRSHVEVPLAKRRPPRTGANENDPDNETAAPPSRKTSVSRTSSAPPAAAASPVLTQSQTAGSPVPDRKEPGLPVAQMDLDPSSARTSSASSRQYPFAVVVPPKASNSSTFVGSKSFSRHRFILTRSSTTPASSVPSQRLARHALGQAFRRTRASERRIV